MRTFQPEPSVQRLERLAWLLDNCIALPGGYRIGIDGIIGLLPGVGDAIGALLSAYIIYEARQLGASRSLLLRMTGNVMIETVIGSIPILGDLFDFAYKANTRNVALLDKHIRDPLGSRRRNRFAIFGFSLLLLLLIIVIIAVPVAVIMGMVHLFR